ncbi:MAG: wax ester/triacylglycerol synthase family O-acyltransferase [Mycobacterium sp.]|nr:wax ester/triacylglycerol synthase family O-acyltransferase [Mycobacterium sp.]
MQLISPVDSMFLLAESREHPMHVAGLQLFEPPEGAGPEFLLDIHEQMVAHTHFNPTFRTHPATVLGGVVDLAWSVDDEVDIEYHLRRSALPTPGRVRDLLELTGRLHGSLLDRHRPLWEAHLIEGLNDGRFAVYTKVHHALLDGVSASRTMQRSLSNDPDDTTVRVPWDLPMGPPKPQADDDGGRSLLGMASGAFGAAAGVVGTALGLAPSTLKVARAALLDSQLTLPFQAPKTMLNVKIGGARRFAAQSWSLERIQRIKRAAGVTVNDVVLAMCAGALRAYLIEENALPDTPLIAMVPMSLREDDAAGGNQVGALLCNLGTDIEDPSERLKVVSGSMRDNKSVFAGLPKLETLALSAINIAALGLGAVPGFVSTAPPPFNLVISNVPGPREQMYFNGAKLVGNYPVSIVLDNMALNITLANNADNLEFGFIGCRRSVPHLQRLLTHVEDSLVALEEAIPG